MNLVGTIWQFVCACGRVHERRRPVVPVATANELGERVEQLERAIREHQAAMEGAGPLGIEPEFTRNQLVIMHAKHEADKRLWGLVT